MTDLKDLPVRLVSGDVDRRLVLRVLHLVGEDEQVVLYIREAGWGRFALGGVADGWHFAIFSSLPMLDLKLQSGAGALRNRMLGFLVENGACGGVVVESSGNLFLSLGLGLGNLRFARDCIQLHPCLDGTTTSEPSSTETDTSTMVINPTYLAQRTRQCVFSSSIDQEG
jgi:hypothetical protein